MRRASLAVALLLIAPSARAGGPYNEAKLKTIVDGLMVYTRNIKEDTLLPTAKFLNVPPPWEVPIRVAYDASREMVDYGCDAGFKPGGDVIIGALSCGHDDIPDSFGVIMAGQGLWNLVMRDGQFSEDRLAYILAHEIGHIRLKHSAQYWLLYDRLYVVWYKAAGKALEGPKRAREEARYARGAGKALSQDDAELVEQEMTKYLGERFLEQKGSVLSKWSREKESEADDYGAALAEAAGYDMTKVSGLNIDNQYLMIDLSRDIKSHDSHGGSIARDWRLMRRYVLGSGGKN